MTRRNFYQLHILGLCLVGFFLPLKIHYSNIFIGFSLFFWLVSFTKDQLGQNKETIRLFWLFTSLYAIQIVGLVHTNNLRWGLFMLETKLGLLLFPLMILISPITEKHIHTILRVFIVGTLVACIWCQVDAIRELIALERPFLDLFTKWQFQNQEFTKVIPIHPAYLSFCIGIAVFAILELELKKKQLRVLWVCLLVLFIYFLFILMSRAAFVGFAIAFLVYTGYRFVYQEKRFLFGSAIVALFLVAAVLFVTQVPEFRTRMIESMQNLESRLYDQDDFSSTSLHVKQWYCAWNSVSGLDFIWGLGTGDEIDALMKCYTENEFTELIRMKLDAHNEFLSSLVRHGIVGLTLFLINLMYPIWLGFRAKNLLYITFIIMASFNAIGVSVLFGQVSLVIYALFNSLFAKQVLLQGRKNANDFQ